MLTRELGIADFDFRKGRIIPDRLTTGRHRQYLAHAERMLDVYRNGVGRTRQELHRAVQQIFADEPDCPQRRIDAFTKLLDDAGSYEQDRRRTAATLRQTVFRLAAAHHPLVTEPDQLFEKSEWQVKQQIAAELGRPWAEIEAGLFADIIDFQRLAGFAGYPDGRALLSRYNVAQVQVAMFKASTLFVWAREDFKTILRYAKLAGLMHSIFREQAGYRLQFDGPASLLRETRRYGIGMARFLPALIACRDWRLHAVVRGPGDRALGLDLSSADRLHSHHAAPVEFDSSIEAAFAQKWGTEERDGWQLIREAEILHAGQHVFVPDFQCVHRDGRTVLLEIIGFWTPEYLQAKARTLREFRDAPLILAVAESLRHKIPDLGHTIVTYKTAIALKEVLSALRGMPSR